MAVSRLLYAQVHRFTNAQASTVNKVEDDNITKNAVRIQYSNQHTDASHANLNVQQLSQPEPSDVSIMQVRCVLPHIR